MLWQAIDSDKQGDGECHPHPELGASLTCLSKRQYKLLLVIEEVSRQQREMWSEKKTRVDQRIVSLSQPHVRPIVRGKAGLPNPPDVRGARGAQSYLFPMLSSLFS